jgi:competence protein ComEA
MVGALNGKEAAIVTPGLGDGLFLPRSLACADNAAKRPAMPAAPAGIETSSTGSYRRREWKPTSFTHRSLVMKSFVLIAKTLVLSLLLAGAAYATETVNINTADADAIDRVLVNIGPAKAQAIVEYRETNGAFRSVEQLAMVKGIGLKTIEKNRDRIVVSNAGAKSAAAAKPPAKTAAKPANTGTPKATAKR